MRYFVLAAEYCTGSIFCCGTSHSTTCEASFIAVPDFGERTVTSPVRVWPGDGLGVSADCPVATDTAAITNRTIKICRSAIIFFKREILRQFPPDRRKRVSR